MSLLVLYDMATQMMNLFMFIILYFEQSSTLYSYSHYHRYDNHLMRLNTTYTVSVVNCGVCLLQTAATWFDNMSSYVNVLVNMQTNIWGQLIHKLEEAKFAASYSISFSTIVTTALCILWPTTGCFFYWNQMQCFRLVASIIQKTQEVRSVLSSLAK